MSDEPELQDVPLETPDTEDPPSTPGGGLVGEGQLVQSKPDNDKHNDADIAGGDTKEPGDTEVNGSGDLGKNQHVGPKDANKAKPKDSSGEQAATPAAKRSSVVDQVMNHSPGDGLKQLAYLEILMADAANDVTDRDVVDSVLNVLVGGQFDLETNFVVKDLSNVKYLLNFMPHVTEKLQAEIWSMLSGILRKSRRNLLAFTEAGFIRYILRQISDCSALIGDLLMDMMTVLAGYSITVAELQLLFTKLKSVDNEWPLCAPKLLKVLQQMPTRHGPDEFFSFPGSKQAAISLPPMSPQRWPYQLGWSYCSWICLDPFTGVSVDQEKPFLFCFQTKNGLGYSAHFVGSVLVLSSNKGPGKGFQASINFDFEPRKWYHICLAYVYNRWKTSVIRCYVNGVLTNTLEMSWFVTASENFDKCYIGAGPDLSDRYAYCGEMSTVYMFNEALSNQTVDALYQLGPAYKGQFKFDNESQVQISDRDRKVLYDGKLTASIILMYSPVACDAHICLDSTPSGNQTLFVHSPHAMMMGEVKAVITHSIHSTLHSLGGIQMLFPLFGQLDCGKEETIDDDKSICTTLMDLLCDLLEHSDTLQQQMMQSRGFLVISHLLEEASPQHLTPHTIGCIIRLVKYFTQIPTAGLLVRQISDHLLFNPALWIHSEPQVQMMLYEYLASEFIVLVPFQANPLRRVSTVLQLIHSIKHFYWVVNPQALSAIKPRGTVKARPSEEEVIQLRGLMLTFIDRIITSSGEILEDELQCFLNFVTTVNEPENLYDVLHLLVLFMIHLPSSMVPLFDGKNGVRAVFKLLSSDNEAIRIQALKLLGHFLSRSTSRRKLESMDKFNLFSLLGIRLLENETHLTMNVYNVLFEVLVERMAHQIISDAHPEFNGQELMIQNPGILKVVARLLNKSKPCEELDDVRKLFLDDLICLCENNDENRRTILQMSVWQDWLFSLARVYPISTVDREISSLVMEMFRILLYHAVRLEYGGWRVWIDTLSILHTRVSYEDFTREMSKVYQEYQSRHSEERQQALPTGSSEGAESAVGTQKKPGAPGGPPKFPAYRIPEFRWSHLHQQLVSDILFSIEDEVKQWRGDDEQHLVDTVNASENTVFVVNAINLVSNLSDVLITAVGGLLPLLSAATTSAGDIDVLEPGYGLSIEKSVSLLQRLLSLADIMVIASNVSLHDLEHEKNMTNGTMLRQCLRIVLTMAVRNCLECRYRSGSISPVRQPLTDRNGAGRSEDPIKSLVDGTKINTEAGSTARVGLADPISNIEHLLQESDVTRLRAVLYREADDVKQAQWVAMSVIYFVSVLMVSKYRDILEPTVTPDESDDTPIFPPMPESQPEAKLDKQTGPSISLTNGTQSTSSQEEVRPSPAVSKRSVRSISPHRPSDSEDEDSTPSRGVPVVADVHGPIPDDVTEEITAVHTSPNEDQQQDDAEAANAESVQLEEGTESSSDTVNEKPEEDQQIASDPIPLESQEDPQSPSSDKPEDEQSQANNEEEDKSESTKPEDDQSDDQTTEAGQSEAEKDDKSDDATTTEISQSEAEKPEEDQSEEATAETESPATQAESNPEEVKLEGVEIEEKLKHSEEHETTTQEEDDNGAKENTVEDEDEEDAASPKQVSSITVTETTPPSSTEVALESTSQSIPQPLKLKTNYQALQTNLSDRLELALGTSAPLLREVFLDFAPYLTKTLLGTKGQELLSGGLTAIKMGTSAISLVMLLCSQEWQISLQKHAGLAFIELVNEGRLLSHSTRDHMVKVANEAEHILNRLRAEDANKHDGFHVECAEALMETVEEELTCDRLITSARRRDSSIASKIIDKVLNIVNSKHGPWADKSTLESKFWKLDTWEDDSRRRRRLLPNPVGSTHPEAALRAAIEHGENEDAINQAREEFHAQLRLKRQKSEAEISLDDDVDSPDADLEVNGPVALSTACNLIAYGIPVAGTLSITKYEIFFEWDDENELNKKIDNKVLKYIDLHGRWHMQEMRAVFSRRYLLEKRAIEIFLINRTSVLFSFADYEVVKRVVALLPPVGVGVKYGLRPSRKYSLAAPKQLFKQSNMTQRWQRREISNFDYLMFLNTIAGRSYNDLNQYPVYPWVLSNYTSESIDLSDSNNYRDLSKPIGALNPERRKFFTERYEAWEHEQIPPFHYGTHYSTAAFTMNWLIRTEPFSTLFLNFQGGKFDHANRTFSSMERAWHNCQSDSSDVKECIPELYYLPEMFLNDNRFKFGSMEDGLQVDNVSLPPWAKSPEEFIRISREALESEIVSSQLHEWIDIIFGYKQQGPEAVKAANVFYYLTYEGNVDLSVMKDPIMKEALEAQIRSFGQTPAQLLNEPHPMRGSQMGVTPKMFTPVTSEACMSLKFWSNSPVIHISANVFPLQPMPSVVTVLMNKQFAVNPWNNSPVPIASQQLQKPGAENPVTSSASPAQQTGQPTTEQVMASLPLALDPVLSLPATTQQARRTLGDNFDERLKLTTRNFTTTIDNKALFACGFWDNSFRVFHTESGRIMQVIYGHFDVVTCICRSEVNMMHDCFLVTGSKDCTCMIWQWIGQKQRVHSDQLSSTHNPVPQATLTGHTTPISCVVISAELGIVVSSSQEGPCLIHTMLGDLLRSLDPPPLCTDPQSLIINREGYITCVFNSTHVSLYNLNGRPLLHADTQTPIKCICMSRDGKYVIAGGDSGVVSIWRSHDLAHLYSYPNCDGAIHDLALSYDQRYLLVAMSTGCVIVLHVDFTKWHHDYQRSKEKKPALTAKSSASGSSKEETASHKSEEKTGEATEE